jgi:hypothetical protein
MLSHFTETIMERIASTPEGTDSQSESLYSASHQMMSKVLKNLEYWHKFNADLQFNMKDLQAQIVKANEHFDGIRESNRFRLAQKFIEEAELSDKELQSAILEEMRSVNLS